MTTKKLLLCTLIPTVLSAQATWLTCASGGGQCLASGNVGVGTASPAGALDGRAAGYDLLTSAVSLDVGLNGISGGWARAFRVVNASGSNGQDGGAFGVVGTGTTPAFAYMSIPTNDPTGYDSTKIFILNNQGNVGIGTTTPDKRLEILANDSAASMGDTNASLALRNTAGYLSRAAIDFYGNIPATSTWRYGAIEGLVTGEGAAGDVGAILFGTKYSITDSQRTRIADRRLNG